MNDPVQIVGLVRFSALSEDYYSETFSSVERIADHLFSPERMALRFRLFENLCLASLAGQTDDRFDCVVLTSQTLPGPYLKRLNDLLAPHPHLHLLPVPVGRHYQQIKTGYASVPARDFGHRVSFRLDDDDGLDRNYIKRLREMALCLRNVGDPDEPRAIAFNSGFYVRIGPGGNEIFDAVERAPLSTGTAILARNGYPKNPYRYNHRALPQYFSTYQDLSRPTFIRTIHADNKSRPTPTGAVNQMPEKRMRLIIKEGFGLKFDMLRGL